MRVSVALSMLTATVLAVPGSALAGGTSATSKKMVSANASVSSCGSLSGITITWTATDGVISAASLDSIPAGCNGASLSLTLANSSGTSLGSAGPVTVTGTSQTLGSITGSPDATAVATAHLSAVGP